MATNFEPHACVILYESTKIGTHEHKAIRSKTFIGVRTSFNTQLSLVRWPKVADFLHVPSGIYGFHGLINNLHLYIKSLYNNNCTSLVCFYFSEIPSGTGWILVNGNVSRNSGLQSCLGEIRTAQPCGNTGTARGR